ncbi:MAG TPA: hypothetical protein VF161_02505 [Steroidobacteraceae bacterium]|jgi:hypothetical protein
MDRSYIDREHIVERYLGGDLTVREAREFEQFCRDHPEALKEMPIPVRLKARLARRPLDDSETGMFQAIPSSATHAAFEAAAEGLDLEDEVSGPRESWFGATAVKVVIAALGLALVGALAGLATYAAKARSATEQLEALREQWRSTQMRPPGRVQRYRVQPVRAQPSQPTLSIGWPMPPELVDLHIDMSEGKFTQFMLTIEKVDGGRIMQIRRIARDSNRELRLGLNSSAFGPGEYLIKIDGYTWRGQTQEVGWVRLDLQ